MSSVNPRYRRKHGTGFLESLIDPIDLLSETMFSILIMLLYLLTFRFIMGSSTPEKSISQGNVNELLIGALGAVVAWGMIDGIMYMLLSLFGRGESHRLLNDIQSATTEQEAVDLIAEEFDYMLEPITGENERKALYHSIFLHLRNSTPRKIGFKLDDLYGVLGHVLVAIIAVIPSIIPFFIFRFDYELAFRISILVSFIVLFVVGFRWGTYTGANPWKTGLLIMSVAVILVLIAVILEG